LIDSSLSTAGEGAGVLQLFNITNTTNVVTTTALAINMRLLLIDCSIL